MTQQDFIALMAELKRFGDAIVSINDRLKGSVLMQPATPPVLHSTVGDRTPAATHGPNDPLSPCPFCNAKTPIVQLIDDPSRYLEDLSRSEQGYIVICSAESVAHPPLGCGASSGWARTPSGAVRKWNRRSC